jgi:hypothetical protein
VFGQRPVGEIDTRLVMRVVEPIWKTKNETASRVRGRIETVLDWAKAKGHRTGENPARWAGHLEHLLANRSAVHTVKHHEALDWWHTPPGTPPSPRRDHLISRPRQAFSCYECDRRPMPLVGLERAAMVS